MHVPYASDLLGTAESMCIGGYAYVEGRGVFLHHALNPISLLCILWDVVSEIFDTYIPCRYLFVFGS